MTTMNASLPLGYSVVPQGMVANVAFCLDMLAPPPRRTSPHAHPRWNVTQWARPPAAEYRSLFRSVGEAWLWFSRLVIGDAALEAILQDPAVEVLVLGRGDERLGFVELDFRQPRQCEVAYFGVVPEIIGQGAGRLLMAQAVERAWSKSIDRLWVHTCNFDHPGALSFYRRSGFAPCGMMVEIAEDPRLSGHLPRSAAPHVPLIEPR